MTKSYITLVLDVDNARNDECLRAVPVIKQLHGNENLSPFDKFRVRSYQKATVGTRVRHTPIFGDFTIKSSISSCYEPQPKPRTTL